ncbi:MAG: MarR family transcriptional regulator [Actinobacteria bacterium]|jgi:long-chain acyl-CoA synthetase|nr:MarR family transcriptional regulator [Actinomycetota bacterium]MBT3687585.1 MarR family transcriptional regulator [Actinomycetota bacterium]MBT4036817.1 MarR family transcriptional regulator [Actinomycetota bacterium]MBT4278940.1 MarR family transcriptional regulator [Actinomycetota bacterium]MBT4343152.1 MarR family transcriptional regulator [Actinomycetota bacterium]
MDDASTSGAATESVPNPLALSAARAASRLARQVVAPLSKTELGLSQYRVLVFLSEEGLAPSDLAGRLDVTRPSVTAMMDGLVCRKLVERRPDPDDGRRVTHHLTEAGHTALQVADLALAERLAEIGTFLSPEEADAVARGLELFGEALRAERSSGRMM